MTEGPDNMEILKLATAYRVHFSGKENCEHECKTVKIQSVRELSDSQDNSQYKTMEDENKLIGIGSDESAEDLMTWNKAFEKLRPPPKIQKKKPANPAKYSNRTFKEILDIIEPFCERSRQRRNDKMTISGSVRRILRENYASPDFEDDSEFIVHRDSNKSPTLPFPLEF